MEDELHKGLQTLLKAKVTKQLCINRAVFSRKGESVANVLTGLRALISLLMIFLPFQGSLLFSILYILAGITDIADGIAARALKKESEFGRKFDTAADMLFAAVSFIKILPQADLPVYLWIGFFIMLFIKLFNITAGLIRKGEMPAHHSLANRLAGILLYFLPLLLYTELAEGYALLNLAVALIAAAEEGIFVLNGKKYRKAF